MTGPSCRPWSLNRHSRSSCSPSFHYSTPPLRLTLTLFSATALLLSAQAQVPGYVPTDGLVGWWPFTGNANDESGNENNGSVTGAVLAGDRFGNASRAYVFDGVDDYLTVPHSNSFVLISQFTVSIWLKPLAVQNSVLIEKFTSIGVGAGDAGFQMALRTNDIVDFNVIHTDLNNFTYSSSQSTTGQWHHILASWDGSEIKLYQNGVEMDVAEFNMTLNDCYQPLSIGHRAFFDDLHFNGSIDDIGIWDRALTPAEIQALFSAALPPCVSPDPVSFTGLGSSYTLADAPIPLSGSPAGGVFIGPGVTGNTFDPFAAGVGGHSITYTYVDNNNCINTVGQCTEVLLNVGVDGTSISANAGVRVYPNPNRGQFTVELDLSGLTSMQVFDSEGRLAHNEVFQASGPRTVRSLDLSTLAKGSYSLRVQNGDGFITQTVVVE